MDPRVKPAGDASKLDTGKRGGVIPAPVILNPVIAGLDPAIHPLQMKRFFRWMRGHKRVYARLPTRYARA
jgi:hypothetical protein